jgi:hypothetical protein
MLIVRFKIAQFSKKEEKLMLIRLLATTSPPLGLTFF